jgi:hypothetical protein
VSAALYEGVRRIAAHEVAARPVAGLGVVQDVNPGSGTPPDHSVSVALRDSGLVLKRVPVAVGALGQNSLPASGDLVVVVFCEGDMHEPIVVGRVYPATVDPPPYDENTYALDLPPGSGGSPKLSLQITAAPQLLLSLADSSVEVKVAQSLVSLAVGDFHVKIDGSGSGQIEVASSGGAKITLDGSGNVTVEAPADLKLHADQNIEIQAGGQVKVSGATVGFN